MKKCKSCQSEIDDKAKKCPYCQSDQRSWLRRHPVLTALIVFIGLIIIVSAFGSSAGDEKSSLISEEQEGKMEEVVDSKINDKIKGNEVLEKQKIVDRINEITIKSYADFEVTIWDEEANFGVNANPPFEIILNAPLDVALNSCNEAKTKAYDTIEALYMDTDIRNNISRVLISFPRYLRVSLGASDGVAMADKDVFSGPNNFWRVMEEFMKGKEINLEDDTWSQYLDYCE